MERCERSAEGPRLMFYLKPKPVFVSDLRTLSNVLGRALGGCFTWRNAQRPLPPGAIH
jgi:hypothetical protein